MKHRTDHQPRLLLRRGREAARSGPALLVLALLVLALLAVGCGDDAPSAEPTEAPTTTEAPRKTHVPTTTEAPTTTQAPATAEGADFIELPFFSGFVWESFGDTEADCDTSDPDREVCSFEQTGTLYGTHLGQALDAESGTRTTYLDESCTGSDGSIGNPVVYEASGSMTTLSGDEAFFRLRNPLCSVATPLVANWVIDGGTGRFEDAYGIMSVMPWPGDEFTSVSTGTLRVRADLWEEILPPLTAP